VIDFAVPLTGGFETPKRLAREGGDNPAVSRDI
jgi:hypothetical protein